MTLPNSDNNNAKHEGSDASTRSTMASLRRLQTATSTGLGGGGGPPSSTTTSTSSPSSSSVRGVPVVPEPRGPVPLASILGGGIDQNLMFPVFPTTTTTTAFPPPLLDRNNNNLLLNPNNVNNWPLPPLPPPPRVPAFDLPRTNNNQQQGRGGDADDLRTLLATTLREVLEICEEDFEDWIGNDAIIMIGTAEAGGQGYSDDDDDVDHNPTFSTFTSMPPPQ